MTPARGKRSLEGYTIFPYIAWVLIGLFALFVYHLSNNVESATQRLQESQASKIDPTNAATTDQQ